MPDTKERPLNPKKPNYEWYESEGRLTIASECCVDWFSTDEEVVLRDYLNAKHPTVLALAIDDAIGYPEDAVPYVPPTDSHISQTVAGEWSHVDMRPIQDRVNAMVAKLADAYVDGRERHLAHVAQALTWIASVGVVARFNDSRIEVTHEGFEALAARAMFTSDREPKFNALMGIPIMVVEGWECNPERTGADS